QVNRGVRDRHRGRDARRGPHGGYRGAGQPGRAPARGDHDGGADPGLRGGLLGGEQRAGSGPERTGEPDRHQGRDRGCPGTADAAARRTAVMALRRASIPVADGAAASGAVNSQASGGISTGASIANPVTSSIVMGRMTAAWSTEWAPASTPNRGTEPPNAAKP